MVFLSDSEHEAAHFRTSFVSPWDAGVLMKSGSVCLKHHGQRDVYLCSETPSSYALSDLTNHVMFQIPTDKRFLFEEPGL